MAQEVAVNDVSDERPPSSDPDGQSRPPRRRVGRVLIGVAVALVVLVVAAILFVLLGRDQAEQLSDDQALTDFRASGTAASDTTAGRPAAGVYPATASGTESIGLPGFDEAYGPNAPVTVTHGDAGCFTYRADFNSFHWRSWTFCPSDTATFALTGMGGWTARTAPGLDIATTVTYDCETPVDVLWQGAAVGDTRSGSCTGTNDTDDSVTADAVELEVLELTTHTVGGETLDVVRARTTETFSQAQSGSEVDEWWLDAATGLPVKLVIDARITGGLTDYTETAELELTALTPAT